MKKFLALMALLLCFMLLFVACDEETPSGDSTEAPSEQPSEVCDHEYDNACDAECNLCGEKREPAAHVEVVLEAVEATCTEAGLTAGKKCSVCDAVITAQEEVPAKGHTEVEIPAVAPTCTETGLTAGKKCSVCDTVIEAQKEVPAKDHQNKVKIDAVAPTCTETGLTEGEKCSVCGAITKAQEVVPAKGHTAETIPGKAATCTTTGLTDGSRCKECGITLKEQKEIPVAAHKEEAVAGKPATCTEAGLSNGVKCADCGKIIKAQAVIPALGHTENILVGKKPTCTDKGLTEGSMCSVCEVILVAQIELPATGHTAQVVAGKPATCTEAGLTAGQKCSVCYAVLEEQKEIPAKGHDLITVPGVKPTCTETGKTEGQNCGVCGIVVKAQDAIPAIGHKIEIVPGKAATCTEPGLTDGKKCSVCGVVTVEQEVINASHQAVEIPAVSATCTTVGYEAGSKCKVCGEILVAPVEIPMLEHTTEAFESQVPTCTEAGFTAGEFCTVCEQIVSGGEEIPALGHTYITVPAVDPTCTETGSTEAIYCEVCGDVQKEAAELPAKGHKEVIIPAIEASCTVEGYTAGVKCSVCEYILVAPEYIGFAHKYVSGHGAVAPTCTTVGNTGDTVCTECGDKYADGEEIPALGHTAIDVPAKDATCTETGLTAGKMCSVCFVVIEGMTEVPAVDHVWANDCDEDCENDCGSTRAITHVNENADDKCDICGAPVDCGHGTTEVIPGKDATCTATGLTAGTKCAICGKILEAQTATPTVAHTEVELAGKDATCTETGLTAGKKCSVCGKITVAQVIIIAKGHNAVEDPAVAPTCTEVGYKTGIKCSVCDVKIVVGEEIPATGHTISAYGSDKAPTCIMPGAIKGEFCTVCNTVVKEMEQIPALGHDWADATCTEPKSCTRCDKTQGDALGHTWVDATCTAPKTCSVCGKTEGETIAHTWVDATCTAPKTCSVCGKTEGDALGHTWVDATCTAPKTCSVCGKTEGEALGHTVVVDAAVAPTCTETGLTEGSHCSVCGVTLVAQETVEALNHADKVTYNKKDATCTVSGMEAYSECIVCGQLFDVAGAEVASIDDLKIPVKAHTETEIEVAPTCVDTGLTGGVKCADCGLIIVPASVVPATGIHTEVALGEPVDPTCTETGLTAGIKCEVCGLVIEAQATVETAPHTYSSDCDVDCDVCGDVRSTGIKHTYGLKTGVCTVCGVAHTDYADMDNFFTMQEAYDYESADEEYLLGVPGSPDANISHDGYIAPGQNNWLNTGANSTPWSGEVITVSSKAEKLDINFFGWVAFGDFALEEFGVFVDELTSVDDIIYNANAGDHLDMYNGTGPLVAANMSADVAGLFGPNARRYCMALFNTNAVLWNELKTQPGNHNIHIVAKLEGGYYVVVQSITINVFDHECTFPEDGTQGVGTVTAPTCTADGYTTVGCTVDCLLCPSTTKINATPAMGHDFATGDNWTFKDGYHWYACQHTDANTSIPCQEKSGYAKCEGADGATCDVCKNTYACKHDYVLNADGSMTCQSACGVTIAAPTVYLANDSLWNAQIGAFNVGTIEQNSTDKYTVVRGTDGDSTVLSIGGSFSQYVVMRYRTGSSDNITIGFAHYNTEVTGEAAGVSQRISIPATPSNGEWKTMVVDMGSNCPHGRVDLRFKFNGNTGAKFHLSYFASFNTLDDANSYAAALEDGIHAHSITYAEDGTASCACGLTTAAPTTFAGAATLATGAPAGHTESITNNGTYVTLPGTQNQFQIYDTTQTMSTFVVIRYRATAANQVMFTYYDTACHPETTAFFTANGDGEWHTATIQMTAGIAASANKIVWGMSGDWNNGGSTVDIESVTTFTTAEAANDYAAILNRK